MVILILRFHVKHARFWARLQVLLTGLNKAMVADVHQTIPRMS